MDFYIKMLTTHNRCQTSASKRIQEFPDQEGHLKYLQDRLQEDEISIQQIKGITEKVVKNWVAQASVSNFFLEDLLRVTPPKAAEIKSQLDIHEVTVRLLEPIDFKTIVVEDNAWKEFIGGSVGPS